MKSISLILLMFISFFLFPDRETEGPLEFVNPFIGTGGEGHTFPGAVVPFGMIQVSPDTELHSFKKGFPWCAGYRYEDNTIVGFSHTHFSGTGHSDMGDILLMPFTGLLKSSPGTAEDPDSGYRSRFDHQNESASPGYYTVKLSDYNIKVELSASKRVGIHRYIFPKNERRKVLLDLVHSIYNYEGKVSWARIRVESKTRITGYRRTHGWGPDRVVFFVIDFSYPIDNYGILNEDDPKYRGFGVKGTHLKNYPSVQGRKIKAYFEFGTSDEPLLVKVGISGVDIGGAIKNLEKEIPHWDFDRVVKEAKKSWKNELSFIDVKGTKREKENFYTSLYHTFISPSIYMDVDNRYRGIDNSIHTAEGFENHTIFSLWDTYRALHPLFTIFQPEKNVHMIKSMVEHFKQSEMKMLPIWSFHGNETWCMIGYHAVSVIADAYMKGLKGINESEALEAMVTTARNKNYGGLSHYMKFNYVPVDLEKEGASKTLEYAYDDWTIARMAKKMGREEIAKEFFIRSLNYRNIFDKNSGFMRAKNSDGKFREPFDPMEARYGGDYTEGNAWQYSWYVPHDTSGLIDLLGGDHMLIDKLDHLFNLDSSKEKFKEVEDISGLIGQYAHGNEPSHNTAYLYVYAGAPRKTQGILHRIVNELYDNTPDGIPGNEDCGQMSAWYIFTSLGFYPVAPGSNQYVIGAPFLDEVSILLPNGNRFRITTYDRNEKNIYIQKVKLNGKNMNRTYIYHREILNGGELKFFMGNDKNSDWGSQKNSRPYSLSGSDTFKSDGAVAYIGI